MKILSFLLILSMFTISCSDSKQQKLANDFVQALNFDLGYDVEIVKVHTRQDNYMIVKDYDLDTLDAYNLENYRIGSDVGKFLDNNESSFYYDLEFSYVDKSWYWVDDTYGHYNSIHGYSSIYNGHYEVSYEDIYVHEPTGIQFSKINMTSSDVIKAQELIDAVKVKKATNQLTVQFGLAPKRAKEVAGLALQLNNADKATMTSYQYNQYSKAVLGSTYTDIRSAINNYTSGDQAALNGIYSKAARTNGISVKQVKQLTELFIKN